MQRKVFLLLTVLLSVTVFSVTVSAQQRFIAHLNGIQEVPVNNSAGTGSCTITLNAAQTQISVSCNYTGLGSNLQAGHIHGNAAPGANAGVLFNFNPPTGNTSGTFNAGPFNVTPQQVADMRAKRWYVNLHSVNLPGGEIRGQIKITNTVFDYDGDGRTDITIFRQSDNAIYTLSSLNNSLLINRFGSGANDTWFGSFSDFDGDGRADHLLRKFNPALTTDAPAYWSILQSGSNTVRTVRWGNFLTANAERVVFADYDGDGRTDIAVFRGSDGFWYILESSTGNQRIVLDFGAPGNVPTVGDFDGDGKNDLTVLRAEGTEIAWYTQLSSTGQSVKTLWGSAATDSIFLFSQIDVDGDGKQDRMTRRTVGGQYQFNILRSSDGGQTFITWGQATPADANLFGDYDGDGKTDFVMRRDNGGQLTWYILLSSNSYNVSAPRVFNWGITGDQ